MWPEDVREYFGDGDECHMAYHFPLMPRMYMAIAQEDRHPVVEILQQTPEIPPACQWAIFLRNHDELTLEMVTSKERDYMYSMYAADARARINLGIRRRLAPLLENDRDAHQADEQPAAVDAGHAGAVLRRRDRHGRQHLPRRPRRRAHADAVDQRPQRRLLARRPAAPVPAADPGPDLRLRGVNVEAQRARPRRC
jgi:glycosidase